MDIVTYSFWTIEFDYQRKQIKSYAREMSYQNAVGNRDETSGDQCTYDEQCVLRVIGGRRAVSGWKVYGSGIVLSALYDSIESRKHWISNNFKRNF